MYLNPVDAIETLAENALLLMPKQLVKIQMGILGFTMWGGFYDRVYTIDRYFSHQMIDDKIELVPYNCGFVIWCKIGKGKRFYSIRVRKGY